MVFLIVFKYFMMFVLLSIFFVNVFYVFLFVLRMFAVWKTVYRVSFCCDASESFGLIWLRIFCKLYRFVF